MAEILYFTKWRGDPCAIWAVATYENDMSPLLIIEVEHRWEERLNRPGSTWMYDEGTPADKWTTVPENEWPDEVCAALAKRVLLGEANNG